MSAATVLMNAISADDREKNAPSSLARGRDNFQQVYPTTAWSELEALLKERETNTVRISAQADAVRFYTLDQLEKLFLGQNLSDVLGVEPDLVSDTRAHTELAVTVNGTKPMLMGASTWVSAANRMRIYGDGWDKLEPELQAEVLNQRFTQIGEESEKEVQLIQVDGKVRAIMSDKYAIVVAADLFSEVRKKLEERFQNVKFDGGYADHQMSEARFLLPDLGGGMAQTYGLPDDLEPGVLVRTSDTGFSSNQILPFWKVKNSSKLRSMVSGDSIVLIHKGDLKLEDVLGELPQLFARYSNVPKQLAKLLTINIHNPSAVIKRAAKRVKLSKRLAKELAESFQAPSVGYATAYDVVMALMTLADTVIPAQRTIVEEKIGKALFLNYEKLADADDDDED